MAAQKPKMALSKSVSGPQVKKLSIKNFSIPTALPSSFEEDTWADLKAAVIGIYTRQPIATALETLYKYVEQMCAGKLAQNLYENLTVVCEDHVKELARRTLESLPPENDGFLKLIDQIWKEFCSQTILIRNIFLSLDRTYVSQAGRSSLWDRSLDLFRSILIDNPSVHSRLQAALLDTITRDRSGEAVDRSLVKRLVRMLSSLHIYQSSFEGRFFTSTAAFYTDEGNTKIDELEISAYLAHVERRLAEEKDRCQEYLEEITFRPLLAIIEDKLIRMNMATLKDKGVGPLMDAHKLGDLAIMHGLFGRVASHQLLRDAFAENIKKRGGEIVNNTERDPTMVEDLLAFKAKMDEILVKSFQESDIFRNALKESFEKFINQRANKPAELIAKFIDSKLRSGNKDLTEEELETLLDKLLELFRFINGKDVFEAFYKTYLAKRLLNGKSASVDAERSMLLKLKQECGSTFTSKLEGMFKDINMSEELMASFRQSRVSEAFRTKIDLTVDVLTASNWPTYAPVNVILPQEMTQIQEVFKTFFCKQHNNKRLSWQNNLGHCLLVAHFPLGQKDLQVSLYQTIVLMLFNEHKTLKFSDILAMTNIDKEELIRIMQSLALGKVRVLLKNTKAKEVADDDKFAVNDKFTNPHKRVKINQISQKETAEEQAATQEKVFQDRIYAVDAAIVRIMKTRKSLKHNILISELLTQLKFPVKPVDLKKRIESLIDREYMARDPNDTQLYSYLA